LFLCYVHHLTKAIFGRFFHLQLPIVKQDVERLENVQRRFTKRLVGLKHVEYAERFKQLNLHSLELQRLHTDLIWCYKIVFVWFV